MFDHSGKQIYLICGPTDMRKGTDGLSAIVNLQHVCDSYESAMFIFCSRTQTKNPDRYNSYAVLACMCYKYRKLPLAQNSCFIYR